jgi:hypothetical protein
VYSVVTVVSVLEVVTAVDVEDDVVVAHAQGHSKRADSSSQSAKAHQCASHAVVTVVVEHVQEHSPSATTVQSAMGHQNCSHVLVIVVLCIEVVEDDTVVAHAHGQTSTLSASVQSTRSQ